MPTLSLNSNLPALRAARSLQTATTDVSSLFKRLSSGKRINQASDDPAGLAEASLLTTSGRVYTQATRNINDSISFFNVADAATSALTNILDRLDELATQASNGVMTDTQRQALDQESQSLQQEYGRILSTATCNGTNVFTVGTVATQAGFGAQSVILANIPGDGYTATLTTTSTTTITTTTTSTTTITTTTTTTTVTGDGTFQAKRSFGAGANTISAAAGDFNGDGQTDVVTGDHWDSTVSVLLGNGNGTLQARRVFTTGTGTAGQGPYSVTVADINGDGKSDLVSANYDNATVSVLLGNGNGTFQAKQNFGAGTGRVLLP